MARQTRECPSGKLITLSDSVGAASMQQIPSVTSGNGYFDLYSFRPSADVSVRLAASGYVSKAGLTVSVQIVESLTRVALPLSLLTFSSITPVEVETTFDFVVAAGTDYVIQAKCVGGTPYVKENFGMVSAVLVT